MTPSPELPAVDLLVRTRVTDRVVGTLAGVRAYPGTGRGARAAEADGFLRLLPEGYATARDRAPFSGGEVQRLGLARAFARPGRSTW